MNDLRQFEQRFYEGDVRRLAGVDEVGRGPIAGPVAAAAVIFPEAYDNPDINDSKKLSAPKRERLVKEIEENALAYAIGWSSVEEINEFGIVQANFKAMRSAVKQLSIAPDFILVDGNQLPELGGVPAAAIVGGDQKSLCIAAASILAKVARDQYMIELAERYPEYGFAQHKGYGTELHRRKIRELGSLPVHRSLFLRKILAGAPV